MSLIPELSNPYLTSFTTGLLYGLVACTATCLPYLAGYIASTGTDFRKSVITTLTFNSGRIIAYTLIGASISLFGGLVHFFAEDSTLSIFQTYSTIAFSVVTILIGVILLYKNRKPSCNCNRTPINPKRFVNRFDVGAFTLGLSRGLVLCPPLIALLLYSIPFANPIDSIAFAVLFGIGTAISPMLLIGGVTGWLLNKAPLLRTYIAIAGAAIIIILGISTLISSILTLA
ncbi:MAG: sulfite exporter TauE/SafE family protein [Candidatus Bathyarchaeota archaeon]|nr:sulfite exporter TauE/SafE family protein [Candidatus Termiticorpusculum sp.]